VLSDAPALRADGDGLADMALVGGKHCSGALCRYWTTVPIAASLGRSTEYYGFNGNDGGFYAYSKQAGAVPVAGDFDGDGRSDVALIGGPGWATIPIAHSNGDGTFWTSNGADGGFSAYTGQSGVQRVSGDFNCDGLADVALVGGPSWNTIPIAYAKGDFSFQVTNGSDGGFHAYSSQSGVKVVSGDFNGDCYADIALVRPGWSTIPVAFNSRNGTFTATNKGVTAGDTNFTSYVSQGSPKAVAGDFNGDGYSDIALVGGSTSSGPWGTMPQARSRTDHGYEERVARRVPRTSPRTAFANSSSVGSTRVPPSISRKMPSSSSLTSARRSSRRRRSRRAALVELDRFGGVRHGARFRLENVTAREWDKLALHKDTKGREVAALPVFMGRYEPATGFMRHRARHGRVPSLLEIRLPLSTAYRAFAGRVCRDGRHRLEDAAFGHKIHRAGLYSSMTPTSTLPRDLAELARSASNGDKACSSVSSRARSCSATTNCRCRGSRSPSS
jgi:hypothetical protein